MDFDVFEEVKNDTLTDEQLNSAISTRWVKVRKHDGTVRCRLVVRGYDQVVEDLDDTFASTPSLTTLKLLLTLAVTFEWKITALDISTAFLHALVTGEEILVIPPVEFYPEGGVLWKLRRALYGLRNAPRLWQDHFASVMQSNDFSRCKSDPNLYVHKTKKLYVLAYVDDLMVFGSDEDVKQLYADLSKDLLVKQTGELSEGNTVTFLGRQIKRNSDSIELFMKPEYVDNMLEAMDMKTCKPTNLPGGTFKSKETPQPLGLSAPNDDHMARMKHLLRYLQGTKDFAQTLRPTLKLHKSQTTLDVNVFVDSDWAGCAHTRRSTSGVSLYILGACVLSHSRTQSTVALSSGEAELYAIGSGTADALFIRSLVLETTLFSKVNLTVHTDSTAGKSMAGRFGTSRKTKHVSLRYLYIQELVASGLVKLKKVLGTLNPADVLTKDVSKDVLYRHLPTLGLFSPSSN
eukprot:Skav212273  [mRNA]  locus=scaffold732:198163:199647:- [translate_table: standard]